MGRRLARHWKRGRLLDGAYRLQVAAEDTRGNVGRADWQLTVANHG